ncbi:hypothetical protein ZWY2020_003875 [Hordeum vulgare]|nr:hypothetical protein ZWY2020_003875 [Hordeum vulgare]
MPAFFTLLMDRPPTDPGASILFDNGTDADVAFYPVHGYGPCPSQDLCPMHGYGPCPTPLATPPPEPKVVDEPFSYPDLPTSMPANEDEDIFAPPGYGRVPAMMEWEVKSNKEEEQWLNSVVKQDPTTPLEIDKPGTTIPDLTTATGMKIEDAASSSTAPASPSPPPPASPRTPPPAARRILCHFVATLEQHCPGLRSGSWALAGLHLPGYSMGGRPPLETRRHWAPLAMDDGIPSGGGGMGGMDPNRSTYQSSYPLHQRCCHGPGPKGLMGCGPC